ncbi:hypothetical protein ALC60_03228 [Trachymyrmex zeteki]|uniref:Uncharacterized protein n=1 Tax=Mycetomoellerius zeteki TaxID=64791 RepID=A0A151XBI6_9HYME|nr:hypothetical protein ALC60_03228 [Trachymyrmex zeteki]
MILHNGPPLFGQNNYKNIYDRIYSQILSNAGTCSIGLISRNSLECCSPPLFTKLTGFISYGISFRFNAINKHQKHLNL